MASKALMRLPSRWRGDFIPAQFGNANFYMETGSRECGHRLVIHEFPKKDEPYTEHMGRRYYSYQVRGYCIQSRNHPDYRSGGFGRDELQEELDKGEKDFLFLPFMDPVEVRCRQYRMTEEKNRGGYVAFDMQFVEASKLPFKPTADPKTLLLARADELHERALVRLSGRP